MCRNVSAEEERAEGWRLMGVLLKAVWRRLAWLAPGRVPAGRRA